MPCGRGSRSPRRARTTRTGTRAGRRWADSARAGRVSTGRTRTGPSRSSFEPTGWSSRRPARGGRPRLPPAAGPVSARPTSDGPATAAGLRGPAAVSPLLCAIPIPVGSPAWVAARTPPDQTPASSDRSALGRRSADASAPPTGYDPAHDRPRPPRGRERCCARSARRRGSCATPARSRDVAALLALRADQQGHPVDRRLAETAALLHDVDKLASAGAPAHLRHGEGSAAWLEARGYAELAPVVRDHPVTRLAEPAFDGWSRTAPLEARHRRVRGQARGAAPRSRWTSGSRRGGASTRRARIGS